MMQDVDTEHTSEVVTEGNPTLCEEGDTQSPSTELRWYVLRDLKRANAKTPAYKDLAEKGFEVFTPMQWKVAVVRGKRKRFQVPVLSDLLFVHTTREALDPEIQSTVTLQYRYVRGGYCKPMTVHDDDMMRFIIATTRSVDPQVYSMTEIEKLSVGKNVKILGGALDGIEGKIVHVRGAKKKRILVSIPNLIAAVVEVEPEFVTLVE